MRLSSYFRHFIPTPREPSWRKFLKLITAGILGLAASGFIIFVLAILIFSIGLPDVRDFDKLAGIESTIIYDREGGTLYTIHGEENRKYVPLSDISPHLQHATVAIEDDEFYEHGGFDLPGIGKAVLHEIFGFGARRGGSTITQQLAKNAFLSAKRAYSRKLRELILAVRLESTYDKDKILELYLNRIPYGSNAYGAEMASKIYFGKSARHLTLAEAAILASLPKAPTYYSPFGSNSHSKLERQPDSEEWKTNPPKTIADLSEDDYTMGLIGSTVTIADGKELYLPGRTDLILKRMEELGYIVEEERNAAEKEIRSLEFQKYRTAIRAAHFVFYIRSLLEAQFGKDVVEQGGLQVYTTLDPKLQDAAEEIIAVQIEYSKKAHDVSSAALFSVNARTGEILSMVGSADYFDTEASGNVNHVFARRQPGSSFKPIVYAKTFTKGYSPATVIYDTPTDFGNNYRPQNFEGKFQGPMPIRRALGQSRNIPALKAYFLAGEENEIVDFAHSLGIQSLKNNADYGPPLAIGAGEVTLSEMVQAFSVFASGGMKREPFAIFKVNDRNGDVLYERKPEEEHREEALDPQVAYLINSILSDKSMYLGQRLDVPGHTTAAKTGTSNKEITPVKILPSNLWTVGYSPEIVTGVWAGNSSGKETNLSADGYTVSAPIWSKFMTKALEGRPNEAFPVPEGIKRVKVSRASGKLPSPETPYDGIVEEVFASFSVPTELDDVYKQLRVNEKDGLLPNEYTPEEYVKTKLFMDHHDTITDFYRWNSGIREWVRKRLEDEPGSIPNFPPTEVTPMFDRESAAKAPTIQILSPSAFATVPAGDLRIEISVHAPHGVSKVSFFLDDRTVPNSTKREMPYIGLIRLGRVEAGAHTITARVYDKKGYSATAKVEVRVE